MATPDPLGLRAVHRRSPARTQSSAAGWGSWMTTYVPVALERARRCRGPSGGRSAASRRPLDVGTLQRVVDRLGDREELVAAVDHLPVGVDPDAAQQRDVGGEQLGDTTAVGGGVDVQDPGTLQRLCQRPGSVRSPRRRRSRRSRRASFSSSGTRSSTVGSSLVEGTWLQGLARLQSNLSSVATAVACPDKFRGTLTAADGRGSHGPGPAHGGIRRGRRACRSPTAARARSTRCSRRVAVHAAGRPSPDRSVIRSRRRGRCSPTAPP